MTKEGRERESGGVSIGSDKPRLGNRLTLLTTVLGYSGEAISRTLSRYRENLRYERQCEEDSTVCYLQLGCQCHPFKYQALLSDI